MSDATMPLAVLSAGVRSIAFQGVGSDGEPIEIWRLGELDGSVAKRVSRLIGVRHPNVLEVREVRLFAQPSQVILAPLGASLADDSTLVRNVDELRTLFSDIAAALAEAHRSGVVHGSLSARDIGRVSGRYVVDLSGVRDAEWVRRAPELTRDQTPTAAADLWGLGWIIKPLVDAHHAGRELQSWVTKLLEEDPEARPTAKSIVDALDVDDTMTDPAGELSPGVPQTLGPYRLLERIGSGGMGTVYRAAVTNPVSGEHEEVAIKLLSNEYTDDPMALRRFRREARLLSQLDTPHIARFIAAREDRGTHYLAMELVNGTTARALLREQGQLPLHTSFSIASDVARALQDIHALGLVHRDVKPSNVLVELHENAPPTVKLCDFGLVRSADEAVSSEPQLTQLGATPGTPTFMAPEQIRGLELDARVDVYALGATLYTLVVGHPPYMGAGVLADHLLAPIPDPRNERAELPDQVAEVIMQALSKEPSDRFPDAHAFLLALDVAVHGDASTADSLPRHRRQEQPLAYEFSWDLRSQPVELWPHVSNTERLNRAIGLEDVDWEQAGPDDAGAVRRFGQFQVAGMRLRWKENPFEWVAPRRLGVLREYESGPFHWMRSSVSLERIEERTRLTHRIEIVPRNALGRAAAAVEIGVKLRRGLGRVYRRIDAVAQAQHPSRTKRGPSSGEPHAIADVFEAPKKLSRARDAHLDRLTVRLVAAGGDAEVAHYLADFIREASPQALGRIRPNPWARARGLHPDVVLNTFLLATSEGILTFLWDILCPSCRIPSSMEQSLEALREHSHCEACDLDFELDLARSVELVFRSHDDLCTPDLGVYCIGGPGHSPHVLAQVQLRAGERFELKLSLAPGLYDITGRRLGEKHRFRVHEAAVLTGWNLPLRTGLSAEIARSLRPEQQTIRLENDLGHDVVVRVEQVGDRADVVTAADAACHALFRKLFPGELLSPSQLVGISNVALLIAELADTILVSPSHDDERADYRALMDLQQRVTEAAGIEGGALVKLHGAGVLAVFTGRAAALRSALTIARDPTIRAAVHAGPTMMTTINQRLDYFGNTVQIAEQLLACANGGEIVLSEDIAMAPGVGSLVKSETQPVGVVGTSDGTLAQRVRPL